MRQANPNHQKNFQIEGYKDLGWQNGWTPKFEHDDNGNKKFTGYHNQPEYSDCRQLGHKTREIDNSISLHRGTNNIVICDKCKHFSHYDCSD
jgi:hypothetical protein